MESIKEKEILDIVEKHTRSIFNKSPDEFTDEEEKYYLGYLAGVLKGLRLAGVKVETL